MPSPQQNWARLRADYGGPLRRGAWYRVVSVSPLEAVVDVEKRAVLLPREYLEIVATRPTRWTVVREAQPSPRLPSEMQERYGVCPSCRERMSLAGEPRTLRCRRCNGVFEVGWGERYFDAC
jgi:hypothetical protein